MIHSRAIVTIVTKMITDGTLTRREAADLLEASIRTIHNYVRRYQERGDEGLIDHRGGNFCKLTQEKIQKIINCKLQKPQRSARWIRDWLKLDVSVETVRRVLITHNQYFDANFGSKRNKMRFNQQKLRVQ
jgi:transposase